MKFTPTKYDKDGIKCTYVGGALDGEKEYVLDPCVIRKINGKFERYEWISSRKEVNEDGSYNFIFQEEKE